MFEFVESIQIKAPSTEVWRLLSDVERWWLPSNPEHIRLEVHPPKGPIALGTKLIFEERVAGIPGRAQGRITEWVEGSQVTWEGYATYRYLGIPIQVQEGVTWRLEPRDGLSQLSARVWAVFPSNLFGRIAEWYVTVVLNAVDRDREHARRELDYLKRAIEFPHSSPDVVN